MSLINFDELQPLLSLFQALNALCLTTDGGSCAGVGRCRSRRGIAVLIQVDRAV